MQMENNIGDLVILDNGEIGTILKKDFCDWYLVRTNISGAIIVRRIHKTKMKQYKRGAL